FLLLFSPCSTLFFTLHPTSTTTLYTLSLHDALPISRFNQSTKKQFIQKNIVFSTFLDQYTTYSGYVKVTTLISKFESSFFQLFRSEEHTSELQSRENLVCRLLLEKKNTHTNNPIIYE